VTSRWQQDTWRSREPQKIGVCGVQRETKEAKNLLFYNSRIPEVWNSWQRHYSYQTDLGRVTGSNTPWLGRVMGQMFRPSSIIAVCIPSICCITSEHLCQKLVNIANHINVDTASRSQHKQLRLTTDCFWTLTHCSLLSFIVISLCAVFS